MGKVYLLVNESRNQYKIGITKSSVEKRVKQLQTGNGDEIDIVRVFESDHYRKIETYLHRKHGTKRLTGEWFDLTSDDMMNFVEDCETAHKNFQALIDSGNPFI